MQKGYKYDASKTKKRKQLCRVLRSSSEGVFIEKMKVVVGLEGYEGVKYTEMWLGT